MPRLAFARDLVLAADSAKFIEVFVRRSLVPDGGAYLLPRLIGPEGGKKERIRSGLERLTGPSR